MIIKQRFREESAGTPNESLEKEDEEQPATWALFSSVDADSKNESRRSSTEEHNQSRSSYDRLKRRLLLLLLLLLSK